MRNSLNLNWLRTFEAAARHLSFTAASQEIGLTQTAVSQHIKALEMQLDAKLIVRKPKSLILTDVGKAYLVTVRDALDSIELSTTGLFGPQRARTITIRASMAFIMWLSPKLDSFLGDHPEIGVKLLTSIWKSPADEQPVDVDIILAPNSHSRSDLELLTREKIVPICPLQSSGNSGSPVDLLKMPTIHIMGFDDHWARYFHAHDLNEKPSSARLITDTSTTAIEMVAAGLGCAVVLERFAEQSIQSGQRIRIAGAPVTLGQAHYLVRAKRAMPRKPQLEAFERWLKQQF